MAPRDSKTLEVACPDIITLVLTNLTNCEMIALFRNVSIMNFTIRMPLNSPEDYERLGQHLADIDADLEFFATKHGYSVKPKLFGGRYPNRRITLEGPMLRSIHISMDEMPDGKRFDEFFPDIPYSIFGMAWIDDLDKKTRWHGPSVGIEKVPFSVLTRTLPQHLELYHNYLSGLTEEYVIACGVTSPLRV